MRKPIINRTSVGIYCKCRARFKAKKEFEQLVKDIIDLSIEESPRHRKIIHKRHLYRAVVKKADSLRDYANAVKDSENETEINAETLIDDFRLLVIFMNTLISDAKSEDRGFTEELLKDYLKVSTEDFEKELIQFINQFKNKSDTSLNSVS